MFLLPMSAAVRNELDRISRDFLWEGRSDKRKLHLMKWSNVIKPKLDGGLGLDVWRLKIRPF